MRTLTRNLARENPFGRRVSAHHLDFSDPDGLRRSMEWANVLYNTYWIRVNHKGRTHQQCLEQTKVMFHAARDAGVRRIVPISITNADPDSDLPYFRGKGQLENELRNLKGVSYAILRPTVLYSTEDVLLNNIEWTLRKFPVVLLPGNGNYGIQPVFVKDLVKLAVDVSNGDNDIELDAVGPEVFSYKELNRAIKKATGAKCLIIPAPSGSLIWQAARWESCWARSLSPRTKSRDWKETFWFRIPWESLRAGPSLPNGWNRTAPGWV